MTKYRSATFLTGGDLAPVSIPSAGMFGEVGARFRQADISFLNLEHPLSDKGQPIRGKKFLHRGSPEHVKGVAEAGVKAVNLANNHIMDMNDDGLFDTMSSLRAAGIATFGAGRNLDEAAAPLIFERNGVTVGLLGYSTLIPAGCAATAHTAGINAIRVRTAYRMPFNLEEAPGTPPVIETWPEPSDLSRLTSDIEKLKSRVDVALVYAHWGSSLVGAVHNHQTAIAHAAIDAGADGIFGGHQHVVSAVEFYRDKPIVHCTGNLIFDAVEPWFDETTESNILFGATITSSGLEDCYVLCCETGIGKPPRVHAPQSAIGQKVIAALELYSAPYGTEIAYAGEKVMVRPGTATGYFPTHKAALHPLGVPSFSLREDAPTLRHKLQTTGEAFHKK